MVLAHLYVQLNVLFHFPIWFQGTRFYYDPFCTMIPFVISPTAYTYVHMISLSTLSHHFQVIALCGTSYVVCITCLWYVYATILYFPTPSTSEGTWPIAIDCQLSLLLLDLLTRYSTIYDWDKLIRESENPIKHKAKEEIISLLILEYFLVVIQRSLIFLVTQRGCLDGSQCVLHKGVNVWDLVYALYYRLCLAK